MINKKKSSYHNLNFFFYTVKKINKEIKSTICKHSNFKYQPDSIPSTCVLKHEKKKYWIGIICYAKQPICLRPRTIEKNLKRPILILFTSIMILFSSHEPFILKSIVTETDKTTIYTDPGTSFVRLVWINAFLTIIANCLQMHS